MLDKYLKALLFEHDCVVIPGFGGFVTHYVSAEINPVTNKFVPPNKKVAFNEQLRLSDGLLVSYIARVENISVDKALTAVRSFVEAILEGLKANNQYVLKDIGKFIYNPDRKLEFEPENKVNYAEGSFGLTEFFFKPLQDMSTTNPGNKPPVKPTANPKAKAEEAEKEPRKVPVVLFILIPVVLLLGMGGFFYANKDNSAYSSFNPFASLGGHPTDATEVSDSTLALGGDSTAIASADSAAADSAAVAEAPAPEAAPAPVVKAETQGRFYIIVGSFTEENNAVKLKDKLSKKGLTPTIINPTNGGNYRVSVEDFDSEQKAIAKLNKLKGKLGSTIWLKKI